MRCIVDETRARRFCINYMNIADGKEAEVAAAHRNVGVG